MRFIRTVIWSILHDGIENPGGGNLYSPGAQITMLHLGIDLALIWY